jgi:hypothetical protein
MHIPVACLGGGGDGGVNALIGAEAGAGGVALSFLPRDDVPWRLEAGTYTRPLLSSTLAGLLTLSVSPWLIDWGKIMHPTYPSKCAYVKPKSGRV